MTNDELTYNDIYNEFCQWSPEHAKMVIDYKPWGSNSIIVWFNDGHAYKCKRHAHDRFTMQVVSKEDINRKFGLYK